MGKTATPKDKPKKAAARNGDAKKSVLTRQRIIDAAAKVFATLGYAHTRLSDVAKEAGSHAGGIYYYFSSREALVDEVLRVSTQRSIDDLKAALTTLPDDASAADRLLTAATVQLAGILEQDPYNIAHNRIYPQVPEETRKRHTPLLRQYFAIWRKIISDGQASGEFHADLDPSVLRMTIAGAIQWTPEWVSTTKGSPQTLARKMIGIFMHGARAKQE